MINETYKIEKNIPIPPNPGRGKAIVSLRHYPISAMLVGDSFFVPCSEYELTNVRNSILGTVRQDRCRGKFTIRTVREDSIIGVRCWKISD